MDIAQYLVDCSKSFSVATCSEWESRKLPELLSVRSAAELLSVVDCVRNELEHDARVSGPPVTLLLGAIAERSAAPELSSAEAKAVTDCVEVFLAPAADFIRFRGCDLLLQALRKLLRLYVDLANTPRTYRTCLRTLQLVMSSLAPEPLQLTPAHPLYLQVALVNNHPSAAMDLAEANILEINPLTTGCTLRDFLEHCYYSAVLFASHKRWHEAKTSLVNAMAIPGYGNNAIMTTSFKMHLLVDLVATGKHEPPEIVSASLERRVRNSCKEYLELADAYQARDFATVEKLAADHRSVYELDGLSGLVQQVREAGLRHAVRDLTNVYVTHTLVGMAEELGCRVDDCRNALLDLVEMKQMGPVVIGTVEPFEVTFSDAPEMGITVLQQSIETALQIDEQLQRNAALVAASDELALQKLRSDPQFSQIMQEYESDRVQAKSTLQMFKTMLR